jgi:hypothetical protein
VKPGGFKAMGQLDATCTSPTMRSQLLSCPSRYMACGWCTKKAKSRATTRFICRRPTKKNKPAVRVATPGCQIGYMEHTGCHRLVFWLSLLGVRLVTRGYKDHAGCHKLSVFGDCKITLW